MVLWTPEYVWPFFGFSDFFLNDFRLISLVAKSSTTAGVKCGVGVSELWFSHSNYTPKTDWMLNWPVVLDGITERLMSDDHMQNSVLKAKVLLNTGMRLQRALRRQ